MQYPFQAPRALMLAWHFLGMLLLCDRLSPLASVPFGSCCARPSCCKLLKRLGLLRTRRLSTLHVLHRRHIRGFDLPPQYIYCYWTVVGWYSPPPPPPPTLQTSCWPSVKFKQNWIHLRISNRKWRCCRLMITLLQLIAEAFMCPRHMHTVE